MENDQRRPIATLTFGSIYHQLVKMPNNNYQCSQCGEYENPNENWSGYCSAHGFLHIKLPQQSDNADG